MTSLAPHGYAYEYYHCISALHLFYPVDCRNCVELHDDISNFLISFTPFFNTYGNG